ncbi:hypothetical protein BDV19DRAFT_384232 [Aspergillus venezuelensis]
MEENKNLRAHAQRVEDEVQRRLRSSQEEVEKIIKDEVEKRLESELKRAADVRAESEKSKNEADKRLESTEVSLVRDIEDLQDQLAQSKDMEFETSQQLASAEKERDCLRTQLAKSDKVALKTSQKLKTTEKELEKAYNEQGRQKIELEQADWNLKQRNDDHCKLEIFEPIMEEQRQLDGWNERSRSRRGLSRPRRRKT